MSAAVRNVLIRILLLTLLFGAAGIYLKHSPWSSYYLTAFPILLTLFATVYAAFSWALLSAVNISPSHFINRFVLLSGVKFFILLGVVIVWLFINRESSVTFLIYVFVLYSGYSLISYSTILAKKNYDN